MAESKKFPSYDEVKNEFEKTHFKIIEPVCFCELTNDDELIIRTKEQLLQAYEEKYFSCEDTKTSNNKGTITSVTKSLNKQFIPVWLTDSNKRIYSRMDFKPCQEVPKDVYNMFTGWKASKLPQTTLKFEDSLMYNHMKIIFGNELFEYEMDKLAHIIQTGKKADVTTVLSSQQGSGKDTLYDYFGNHIIGSKYYLNEDYIEMLIGDSFNDMISNKILIVLNESKRAKTDQIIEAIKNAITRGKNSIRAKFVKPRIETNNINWIALTNKHDSIQIEKGDRRFVVNKCSDECKSNTIYFNNIYAEIKSGQYDRAYYDYLMNRQIKIKHFQNERPITDYYKNLQERNIPIIAQFLISIMMKYNDTIDLNATEFFAIIKPF